MYSRSRRILYCAPRRLSAQVMEYDEFYTGLLGFVEAVVQRYDSFLSVAASPECFHLSDLYQVCHRT